MNDDSLIPRDERLAWFREARFGMMITWGIYALKGAGEWVQYTQRIPVKEYEGLATDFLPEHFDAREWVRIAKDAGMKYIVAMAKHHDGFAMFRTKVSNYNVVEATPFGRDPIAEIAEACRVENMPLGLYFSHVREWHHPHATSLDPHNPVQYGNYGNFWDYPFEETKNLQTFIDEVTKPQLREILIQYQPALIWFDTPSLIRPDQARELADIVRELCPRCLINSRIGKTAEWDYLSCGDNEIPDQRGIDFETPMVMNRSWGHNIRKENPYRSITKLIHELVEIIAAGGNFLLNVGPDELGVIPGEATERLQEMGAWLRTHGEAVYGTSGSPFEIRQPWGHVTRKGNSLFLFVTNWQRQVSLRGLLSKVSRCTWIANGDDVPFRQEQQGTLPPDLHLDLPDVSPDSHCAVIRVDIDGELKVDERLVEDAAGVIELRARRAELNQPKDSFAAVSVSGVTERWFIDDVSLTWDLFAVHRGEYTVEAVLQTFFYGEWDIGFTLHAQCGSQCLARVYNPPEGDMSKLCSYEKRTVVLGTITLEPGAHRLRMSASGVPASLKRRCGVTLAAVRLCRQKP